MRRFYLNRVPGSHAVHVEFLPVDVVEVVADLKNIPSLSAHTTQLVEILEETHRIFEENKE
jgi:hypothetical protein